VPTIAESPAALAGETLFLIGRPYGLTRRRLEQLVRAHGGKLATRPAKAVTLVAVCHSSVLKCVIGGGVRLPVGIAPKIRLISEGELRRRLRLQRAPDPGERAHTAADLARIAGLGPAAVSTLALFDVIEPVGGGYAYRDLAAAREVGRLLARGADLARVIEAALALRRAGTHLAAARLAGDASGALVRELAGQLADLSGQLSMPFDAPSGDVDDLLAAAEEAEAAGDLGRAEGLYRTALRADPHDPVLPFLLGNLCQAQGRAAEAKIAWRLAVSRDPGFAEARYNLALAAERAGETELAVAEYRRAVQAQPDYADAQFALALLLTRIDRCAEALPLWDRILRAEPRPEQAGTARRAAALCRMHLERERAKAG